LCVHSFIDIIFGLTIVINWNLYPLGAFADMTSQRRLVHDKLVGDYLKSAKTMDDAIGRILAFLDEELLADHSLVVYTSDQGYFLGERNGFDKRFIWDESIRVPAVRIR
jgi:arylsulfatase A-like enzyme